MATRALTDNKVRNARPEKRVYYLADAKGLRLCVRPNGSRLWMLRFMQQKPDGTRSESTAGLGAYPEVKLEEARRKAAEARQSAADGIHPTAARKVRVARNVEATAATFEVVAREWLAHNKASWSAHHHERNEGLLRRVLFKEIGPLPVSAITEQMLLKELRKAYASTPESARRARAVAAQVFRHAKETNRATHNPARDLADTLLLKKPEVKHFAAIKPEQIGPMLRALAASKTEPVTRAALLLMLYTGLRDYSLRAARWHEIDLKASKWTVPASRMKSGREHAVPLPQQAVAVLEQLATITRKDDGDSFVFASWGKSGHLAENTLRVRLHDLGFKVTAHGFRSLITDLLNVHDFNADAIERQLDHVNKDRVRSAYLRTDFFEQRRIMMQWLADWADAERNEKEAPPLPDNVTPIRQVA